MKTSESDIVFDYRALRLLVGLIALILPVIVVLVASTLDCQPSFGQISF